MSVHLKISRASIEKKAVAGTVAGERREGPPLGRKSSCRVRAYLHLGRPICLSFCSSAERLSFGASRRFSQGGIEVSVYP